MANLTIPNPELIIRQLQDLFDNIEMIDPDERRALGKFILLCPSISVNLINNILAGSLFYAPEALDDSAIEIVATKLVQEITQQIKEESYIDPISAYVNKLIQIIVRNFRGEDDMEDLKEARRASRKRIRKLELGDPERIVSLAGEAVFIGRMERLLMKEAVLKETGDAFLEAEKRALAN